MIDQAGSILKNTFGYEEYRPLQREIIENLLIGKDTLVIMPTGGGKSLCYQIPALIFKGLTVVVSPLISLMKDQVEQLMELGINAVFLNSTLSYEEYRDNVSRIVKNEIQLLYLAPETLLMGKTLNLLSSQPLDCLTIDEAHCISEWGHDFRPEYRQIIEVRQRFPKAVCVALTATATPQVQQDIKRSLHFESSNEFVASFNRENLFLQILQKRRPQEQTVLFLNRFPNQSGIIYCLSRRQVDELTELLIMEDFSVKPYHAGLSDDTRRRNQEAFIRDDVQIMVATIAFGMGINKPNIRFVLHYDLPKNIESYYQQIGRAGRDGLQANCMLLFSYGDIQKIKYFINQKEEHEQRIANIQLNALIGLVETDECRRVPLLRYFGERYQEPKCGMCDNCSEEKKPLVDVTIPAQKFLSCMKRTGEIFGAGHVIDVLRGSKSKKVMSCRHNELSTYGIGTDYSKRQWFFLSRQFIQKGLIDQDMEFGSLKLTPKAWEVLRGKETVFAKAEEREDSFSQRESEKEMVVHDGVLFELLRKKRKKLADEGNIPPYIIFPDKTLIEMAIYFPQSYENLIKLHGVGTIKYEKYGEIFLDIIRDYCEKNQIESKLKQGRRRTLRLTTTALNKPKYVVVGEDFNSGKSILELQNAFDVKLSTIIQHLYRYVSDGNTIRLNDELLDNSMVSNDQRQMVYNTFKSLGTEMLKPIFQALDEKISYDELHMLRLCYLVENQDEKS